MNINKNVNYALAVSITVLLSLIVMQYYRNDTNSLILLSAFLVCPSTFGPTLRQSILRLATLVILVLSFALLLYLTTISPQVFLIKNLTNVILGSAIAIFVTQLFFSRQSYQAFTKAMLPFISAMIDYSKTIQHVSHIQHVMIKKHTIYPNWVFEIGFNPGLRSSFRHYMIELERISDLFIVFNQSISQSQESTELHTSIKNVIEGNQLLLTQLKRYFEIGEVDHLTFDFETDIRELDKYVYDTQAINMELIEMQHGRLAFLQAVQALKDMRRILLMLCLGLQ